MTARETTENASSDLLEDVARAQASVRRSEVEVLTSVVDFAVAHPPIDAADRSRETVPTGGVEGRTESIPLNSSGVPVVSACAVAELGARLAMSTEAARTMVAEALELSYRLPGIWDRVMAGDLQVWKARRIAASTLFLGPEVVGFVDTHLRAVPGHIGVAMLERLIQTALERHDPRELHRRTAATAQTRRLDVHLDQYTLGGTAPVSGVLDLPDAIALDAALTHGAAELAAWGSTDSLDVRRARAGGDLAREHLALFGQYVPDGRILLDEDGSIEPVPAPDPAHAAAGGVGAAGGQAAGAGSAPGSAPGSAGISARQRRRASRREVLLVAHINAAALPGTPASRGGCSCSGASTGAGAAAGSAAAANAAAAGTGTLPRSGGAGRATPGDAVIGRVENTRTPVDVDAIRRWLGDDNLSLTVQPVIDLGERIHAEQYETPTRLRRQVTFRDIACVFPFCGRPATVDAGRATRWNDQRDQAGQGSDSGTGTGTGTGTGRTFAVDIDHIDPYDHHDPAAGGQTATDNLAPLCRHHHRLKTLRDWDYAMTSPGAFAWISPAGHRYRRDHTGSWLVLGTRSGTGTGTRPSRDAGAGAGAPSGASAGSDLPADRRPGTTPTSRTGATGPAPPGP